MQIYRLGTRAYPVWDGAGAAAAAGRWNPPGMPVIYASGSLALAMLERLVQRRNFRGTLVVEADVPDDLPITDLLAAPPRNWRELNSPEAVEAGAAWLMAQRTAVLRVPSAIVPREPNYVVNPAHSDAARIAPSHPEELEWDSRLFGIPRPV
ncbi:MAG: RES domain-containing protein [Acetobacteraceae bacterium]|nr:RES domain-containing protein [Acetobacteraceae bacterium]